mmetsp:Transcript_3507/g.12781  ORF Transcript_3507/g.12781 Transcript_3507/m.12781 type:complete len:678 (-) Transcript_3507:65-2098(-)
MACCCAAAGGSAQVQPDGGEDDLPVASELDAAHPDNRKIVLEPGFGGPCKKRRCTDLLCMLLLVACWACMTGIGFAALGFIESDKIHKGNPYRLINGIDYKGNVCGISKDVKNTDKLYYLPDGRGVCIKKCPKKSDLEQFYCTYNVQKEIDAETRDLERIALGYSEVKKGECQIYYKTKDVLNYCISKDALDYSAELAASEFVDDKTVGNSTDSGYDDGAKQEWYEKVYGDIFLSWPYIVGFGVGGALIVGFVYTFLLRIPGVLALIIWGLLAAIFVLLLAAAAFLYSTSLKWAGESSPKTHPKSQADGMSYAAIAVLVLAGLWFCFVCCMRKRIMLAIGIVREAAKCIAAMPLIVLFPLFQCAGLLVFLVPWFAYAIFLGSSGELKTVDGGELGTYKELKYDKNTYYAGWYMLFTYFWTSEFIVALGQIIIAMACSTWYFTRDKGFIGSNTIMTSVGRSMFYHSGTAAFGSLIIAIIKTIRAVVAYIQKKAKKTKTCKALLQVVLCVIQCCLWCIEKCMKFLNKNAYIQTAIFGFSFCKAARCAFFLILRNIARIAALSIVSGFVLLLGKIIIAGGATFCCYLALNYALADKLTALYAPLILTFFIAYYIATMFNEVWGMAMATILQCFIADEEMYSGDKDAMYAGASLKSCVDNANKGKHARKVKPGDARTSEMP